MGCKWSGPQKTNRLHYPKLENAPKLLQSRPMASAPITFRQVTSAQKRTLIAASLGWALDAFDVMLYAMVITHIMRDLGMTKGMAGLLNTLTLLASGIGGVLFGFLADRIGRKRALMLSIVTYSVFSFASGLATSVQMLAAFRFALGLGMGGEWNVGATLVAETWPTELRASAPRHCAELVGNRLCRRGVGQWVGVQYFDWRRSFLLRTASSSRHPMDQEGRAGIGNVEGTPRGEGCSLFHLVPSSHQSIFARPLCCCW